MKVSVGAIFIQDFSEDVSENLIDTLRGGGKDFGVVSLETIYS